MRSHLIWSSSGVWTQEYNFLLPCQISRKRNVILRRTGGRRNVHSRASVSFEWREFIQMFLTTPGASTHFFIFIISILIIIFISIFIIIFISIFISIFFFVSISSSIINIIFIFLFIIIILIIIIFINSSSSAGKLPPRLCSRISAYHVLSAATGPHVGSPRLLSLPSLLLLLLLPPSAALHPMAWPLSPCAARDWPSAVGAVSQEPRLSIKATLVSGADKWLRFSLLPANRARNGCLISFEWLFLSAQTICHYHVVKRAVHKTKEKKRKSQQGLNISLIPPPPPSLKPSPMKTCAAKQSFYLHQTWFHSSVHIFIWKIYMLVCFVSVHSFTFTSKAVFTFWILSGTSAPCFTGFETLSFYDLIY